MGHGPSNPGRIPINTFAGAAALIAVLLLPLCIAAGSVLLGIIGSRYRVHRLASICAILLCLACVALIGMTRTVDGRVLRKSEQIQLARTGLLPSVLHICRIVVRHAAAETPDASASEEVTLAVDSQSFDRLREGDMVAVRELRLGPLRFARLSAVAWWLQHRGSTLGHGAYGVGHRD